MNHPTSARLLQAPAATHLGALIGEYRALLGRGAADADTATAAERICRSLRSLSPTELETLERAAQGMPAGPARAGKEGVEDEDADPVGRPDGRS